MSIIEKGIAKNNQLRQRVLNSADELVTRVGGNLLPPDRAQSLRHGMLGAMHLQYDLPTLLVHGRDPYTGKKLSTPTWLREMAYFAGSGLGRYAMSIYRGVDALNLPVVEKIVRVFDGVFDLPNLEQKMDQKLQARRIPTLTPLKLN